MRLLAISFVAAVLLKKRSEIELCEQARPSIQASFSACFARSRSTAQRTAALVRGALGYRRFAAAKRAGRRAAARGGDNAICGWLHLSGQCPQPVPMMLCASHGRPTWASGENNAICGWLHLIRGAMRPTFPSRGRQGLTLPKLSCFAAYIQKPSP